MGIWEISTDIMELFPNWEVQLAAYSLIGALLGMVCVVGILAKDYVYKETGKF